MAAQVHANPVDADQDNAYEVTVRATDEDGNSGAVAITVTIIEQGPLPILSISDRRAVESDSAVAFSVTLSMSSSSEVTVDYSTSDGSGSAGARAGSDYVAASGTLTFSTGSTAAQEILVGLTDDAEDEEEEETFKLTLGNAQNASLAGGGQTLQVTGTIRDDDDPEVEVSFGSVNYDVTEGGTVTVVVRLDRDPERNVEIPLDRTPHGGVTDDDYSGVPAGVTFGPGVRTQEFLFVATDDSADDDGEAVVLRFGSLPARVSGSGETTLAIQDNDGPIGPPPPPLRWSRKTGQVAKVYSYPRGGVQDEEAPEVHGVVQVEGGARGSSGGPAAVGDRWPSQDPPESGGQLEAAGDRGDDGDVHGQVGWSPARARGGDSGPSREDRGVDDRAGFLVQGARALSRPERLKMIEREDLELSLSRQCRLLEVSRSSLYYRLKGESEETLGLMRRLDELFLKYPFYGSRQMVRHLRREGVRVGRHRVRRLMRLMGIQAIYQAPRTSKPHPDHRRYPYLLKGLAIERPNQVWCADITYIPVRGGFLYLAAVMDWRAGGCCRGACRTRWTLRSASRPSKKPWPGTASPRSSTRTRAASSPARTSSSDSKTQT